MKSITVLFITLVCPVFAAEPIRVLVWDEQQPEQKQGYGDKFLGETLAAHFEKQPGISVRTAKLDESDQCLSDAALDAAEAWVWREIPWRADSM